MKVQLINWKAVESFAVKHAHSRASFEAFREILLHADWTTTEDILKTFGSAEPIANEKIAFKISGNAYRLICSIWNGPNSFHLYVQWIGTHSQYAKLYPHNPRYPDYDFS